MHVREATELDLIHAKKEDINRTIQVFYQNSTKIPHHHVYETNLMNTEDLDNIDVCETIFPSASASHKCNQDMMHSLNNPTTTPATPNVNTTNNNNISSSGSGNSTNNTANSTIHWMNHHFQLMNFHLGNVLCDVCHKNCSDLLNPPKALECLHCRMRIHFDHVDKHEKFASCHNATNVRYLRMSNSATRKIWIEQFMTLRHCLKELQQTPEQSSALIDVAGGGLMNSVDHHTGGNIVHMNSNKSLYRSMRAGSLGPAYLPNTNPTTTTTTTVPSFPNPKTDFQYSFRRKFVGPTTVVICGNSGGTGAAAAGTGNVNMSAGAAALASARSSKSSRSLSPALVFPKIDDQ
ncbi:unnamed protein product [Schistosoma turkestanicum]|nr:unnamed protein product [Schistosoma turkestanicum]